ncbi:hypothetical protein Ddc_23225 [Ditylenchus destructor]|nr:hypothetical protein Ddc_23225 [Ditylenchus destructor]
MGNRLSLQGQDFKAIRGHCHRVLPLRRQLAVLGHHGPAILEAAHFRAALVEHRLHGKHHAFTQFKSGAGAAKVQDLWFFMHLPADAVAAVLAHHAETATKPSSMVKTWASRRPASRITANCAAVLIINCALGSGQVRVEFGEQADLDPELGLGVDGAGHRCAGQA